MDPLAAYKENAVTTQPRGKLIVALYDGAIKFLKQAIVSLEAGDVEKKNQLIQRAQAVINELDASLNMEEGGDLASNLRSLYDFMRRHLIEANIRRDVQRIRDVIAILEDLNGGWRAIGG
jgi:flagellar protein FliS